VPLVGLAEQTGLTEIIAGKGRSRRRGSMLERTTRRMCSMPIWMQTNGRYVIQPGTQRNAKSAALRSIQYGSRWGTGWGRLGKFWLSFDTLDRLLDEQDDVVQPIVGKAV
jgi:hypothetical protein